MNGQVEQDFYVLVPLLLLINKGEPLNNSYTLVRILERKFRKRNFSDLLRQIESLNYVHSELVKGVHYYHLTGPGEELIRKEHRNAFLKLLQYYPEESKFSSSLFEE